MNWSLYISVINGIIYFIHIHQFSFHFVFSVNKLFIHLELHKYTNVIRILPHLLPSFLVYRKSK